MNGHWMVSYCKVGNFVDKKSKMATTAEWSLTVENIEKIYLKYKALKPLSHLKRIFPI